MKFQENQTESNWILEMIKMTTAEGLSLQWHTEESNWSCQIVKQELAMNSEVKKRKLDKLRSGKVP